MTHIMISASVEESTAKLTGIHVDTDVGTRDQTEHWRIMELINSVAADLVEGLQDILDNPEVEDPDIPLDGPIYPSPIDPTNPFDDPIPTPRPVNPPVSDM